jgi:hypothetical protein
MLYSIFNNNLDVYIVYKSTKSTHSIKNVTNNIKKKSFLIFGHYTLLTFIFPFSIIVLHFMCNRFKCIEEVVFAIGGLVVILQ